MRVLARFMMSVSDPSQFPAPVLPEVAFLGRSNVGKSSVINSLLANKIAKTSSTPGRTRAINFFEVRWPGKPEPELIFTDLPGYGYAILSSIKRPTLIVATKSDRLSGNRLHNTLQALAREYPESRILPYSAKTGAGRQELWQEIREQTADFGPQTSDLRPQSLRLPD